MVTDMIFADTLRRGVELSRVCGGEIARYLSYGQVMLNGLLLSIFQFVERSRPFDKSQDDNMTCIQLSRADLNGQWVMCRCRVLGDHLRTELIRRGRWDLPGNYRVRHSSLEVISLADLPYKLQHA